MCRHLLSIWVKGDIMVNILVVEDQADLRKIEVKYLEREGFQVDEAADGFEALKSISDKTYQLMLLDVMMPGIDGFEVLKQVREVSEMPIIMVTSKQEEVDRVSGFQKGADDYVVKPFSMRELMERVKVLLKRTYKTSSSLEEKAEILQLDADTYKVLKNGQTIELTAAEFKILRVFVDNQNQILTRDQILEGAFGYEYEGFDRNMDSYIKRLRKKLDCDDSRKLIKTKYGAGYYLDMVGYMQYED